MTREEINRRIAELEGRELSEAEAKELGMLYYMRENFEEDDHV